MPWEGGVKAHTGDRRLKVVKGRHLPIIAGLAGAVAAASSASPAADPALGRYLAAECVTCHQRDNRNVGIPPIDGWPADQFVAVLKSYKAKERSNPVMQTIAAGLSEEEMAALAAYFATLKPGG
jgi:cytochrome c